MKMREGEAPSYFNPVEATAVVELIEGLLQQQAKVGTAAITEDDIGVIATYRKQVSPHSSHELACASSCRIDSSTSKLDMKNNECRLLQVFIWALLAVQIAHGVIYP